MARSDKKTQIGSFVAELGGAGIPFVSGAIVLISAIIFPIVMVTARQKSKRELIVIWKLADYLGYNGTDLKRLSGLNDYGSIDWELTRPGKSQIITPSLAAITQVHNRLSTICKKSNTGPGQSSF